MMDFHLSMNTLIISKKNKIPFILFISTEAVGKNGYMNWEQIKEIKRENLHLLVIIHIRMNIY